MSLERLEIGTDESPEDKPTIGKLVLETDAETENLDVNLYDKDGDFISPLVSFGLRKGKVVLRRYDGVDEDLVESIKTKRGTQVINARRAKGV